MSIPAPPYRFSDYNNLSIEVFIVAFTVLPVLVLMHFYPELPERITGVFELAR